MKSACFIGVRERGAVLIVMVWIVLVLAGIVLLTADGVRAFSYVSRNEAGFVRADMAGQGGVGLARAVVDGVVDEESLDEVMDVGRSYVWFISPRLDEPGQIAYVLQDLGGRVNVNTASRELLLALPNMTETIADAIIDWRDGDDEASEQGAESNYYQQLDDGYYCKNDLFESVEELLLVKGMTKEILFGEDVNQNGILDANENDGDAMWPEDNSDGVLDMGLWAYVTVDSRYANESVDGVERVNVNQGGGQNEDLRRLFEEKFSSLSRALTVYNYSRTRGPYENVFDFYMKVEMTREEFAAVADYVTTSGEEMIEGGVNINTAEYEVIKLLPGLEESDTSAIVSAREGMDVSGGDVTWLLDAISVEKAVAIGGMIHGRSMQYLADVVVLNKDGYGYSRCCVVIDGSEGSARVIRQYDMSHLGWPLDSMYVTGLRNAEEIESLHRNVKYQ